VISRTTGWLTLFLIGTDLFVISPLLPGISRSLSVSITAAGWTVTAFAIAYLVGGPSFGALSDRIGPHRVLPVALVIFGGANLLSGAAGTLTVLLAARAVAGMAASGVTPSVYALISSAAPADRRASWLSAVTSGLLLALATGAPAGSLLAAAIGWHAVFFVLAAATVVVLAIIQVAQSRRSGHTPRAAAGDPPEADPVPAPGLLIRLRAISVTCLWALAIYGLYTYLGTIFTDFLRLSSALVAAALACYGIGALAGNLIGGRLTDRYGGRRVSLAALLALAAAEVATGLALSAPAGVLLPALAVFAVAGYPYFSAQQSRLVNRFGRSTGSILAWNNSSMYVGILLGSVVGGQILASGSPRALAFSAAAVAALGALTATWSIREDRASS
jgi:predicted MFS family arabinose efflux permease